ncbi:hypothetical protein COT62_02455 [Candidatus Roizmanbacteria bacterium CG09_land_8_20_14_0_10_41_9]|uniref:LysM domain-containing protein n=1 Tax=Candidatus Roizmanbacteria bacterium CG09_land_8_20_14_0_10_41_9 TaxID=1974850 RepID=A0A2H0WUR2_9BACT|nr:MAG: hypothetical protein COT62_02455 [Candidatus Roizmanbacteria bacterium CG09_land_8_20_14_0_10_41_9]
MYNTIIYYVSRYLDLYPFFIPLGFIGIWRWSVWFIKKITALFYEPQKPGFKTSVSVVTPVYNEDPKIFFQALHTWDKNKPNEIIAVIDYTDKQCIDIFKRFNEGKSYAKLIITKIPGKREALGDGIKRAKSEILALVDSDTIWTTDTLINGIAPFKDAKMGGVATKQSLQKPSTLAQKLFGARLEQRYWDDFPFLAKVGNQIVCLSGRTAFYRKSALLPVLDKMLHEKFMGEKVVSGEDKRLTYLIEEAGWKTTYQSTSQVSTVGERKISTFINQQIRWTRNSWRNDLTALFQGWVFKYPIYAIYLIDRAIQPFTLLISPIYFVISLIFGLWIPVFTILVWWLISRSIKMYPYLKKYPRDVVILPYYIFFNFMTAYIRIYALLSINTQGWITRWHKSRLNKATTFQFALPHLATILIFSLVAGGVYFNKYQTFFVPREQQNKLVASTLPRARSLAANTNTSVLGASSFTAESLLTKRYEFTSEDSLASVAEKFEISLEDLLNVNISKITNWNRVKPGTILTIPPKELKLTPSYRFNYQRIYDDVLRIAYDQSTNTIIVSGRGSVVNLTDISTSVGQEYLNEVSPGVWDLKANLYLQSGITLKLNKEEVKWLRMSSKKNNFVVFLAYNSDVFIDGVKITSWDETKKDYDKEITDGRSYILVKDGARMDVINSEIGYLGYARPKDYSQSPYGISWRMSLGKLQNTLLTGEVINSKFHNNYFGAYTFGATGMIWRGNEFYDNVRYGLDPHDDSNGFLVENNKFYNNGTHGLIFSKRCINNTIRNNVSYNNKGHGIMLHEVSDNNIIENNKLFNNTDGISLDNSSKNTLLKNKIYSNRRGILLDKNSSENVIEKNEITKSSQYGIYLYGKANNNIIRNNVLTSNMNGIYIKTNNNEVVDNQIEKNKIGVYFLGKASQNKLINNKITYSDVYGIYTKIVSGFPNIVGDDNTIWRNKKDLAAEEID